VKKVLPLRPLGIVLLLASFALSVFYVSYTGPEARNPDAASHLAYIRHVAETLSLPTSADCSVCHHPPLYYVAAAAVYRGCQAAGLPAPRGTQWLSLALMGVFSVVSALTIARLLPKPYLQAVAIALVVFWPSTITSAARISNDVAFYAVAALCFHCLVRWWRATEQKWLLWASVFALVGLFVKANALILVVLVAALVLVRLSRDLAGAELARKALPTLAVLVVLTSLHGFVRGSHQTPLKDVLGTAYKTAPKELDPQPASYYLWLEPKPFVRTPYAEVQRFHDREPRFWNHWLKSSLFGTRNRIFAFLAAHEPRGSREIASALNAFLLALLAFVGAGLALTWRRPSESRVLAGTAVAVYAAIAVGFHVLVPAAHHADFRFAFPVLVAAAVLFADVVGSLRRRGVLLWHLGYLLPELVVAFSIAYFVVLSHGPRGQM